MQAFDLPAETCLRASAKTGVGVDAVLAAIVEEMPAPSGDKDAPLRMLMFDAFHDEYRGVICMVLVKDGSVRKGDKVKPSQGLITYEILDVSTSFPSSVPPLVPGPVETNRQGALYLSVRAFGIGFCIAKRPTNRTVCVAKSILTALVGCVHASPGPVHVQPQDFGTRG